MASSGYMGTSNQYVKFWMEVVVNSQNIANNTSNITCRVWAKRTNTGYTTWGSGTVYLKIERAGNNHYESNKSMSISIDSTSRVYHEWTGNVSHNSDGSLWIQLTSNIQIPGILSSSSCGYGEAMPTIPRTSSFTVNKTTCELGSSFVVSISRASSAFTHSVSYTIAGNRKYAQNWNGTATSVTVSPPVSDANYITGGTSTSVTVTVDTYSGSTLIGTATKSVTLTVPANLVPSFTSLGVSRVDNGVPAAWGVYVKGKSKVKLTINGPTTSYGSPISKYTITGGGFTGSTQTYTTGVLNTTGTIIFTATVTDARGRTSTSKTNKVDVLDYFNPTIDSFSVQRCNSDGTLNEEGTYAKVVPSFKTAPIGGKNGRSAKVKYRKVGATAWSAETSVTSGTSYTLGGGGISDSESYEFMLTVSDTFTSTSRTVEVSTAFATMDFLKGGKGVAFGKVAQVAGLLDNGLKAKFREDVTIDKKILNVDGMSIDMFRNAKIVNNSTDFNTLKTPGCYAQSSNANTTNNINMPTKVAFFMEVKKLADDLIIQDFTKYSGDLIFRRAFYGWDNAWTSWQTYESHQHRNITATWTFPSQTTFAIVIDHGKFPQGSYLVDVQYNHHTNGSSAYWNNMVFILSHAVAWKNNRMEDVIEVNVIRSSGRNIVAVWESTWGSGKALNSTSRAVVYFDMLADNHGHSNKVRAINITKLNIVGEV